ncbi:MAG: hypothetical protein AAB426_11795, partial [Myxococcota bacterium]
LLANVDVKPTRLLVNEDVRPGTSPGRIEQWLQATADEHDIAVTHRATPAGGMGPAIQWLLRETRSPIVLHTQEDWLVLRPLPITRALSAMTASPSSVHHVSYNKRKTMRCKHEDKPDMRWDKIEVQIPIGDGTSQTCCVNDHWRTQTGLWRVSRVLPAIEEHASRTPSAHHFVPAINTWMNTRYGDDRMWNDQAMRHERLGTYIWGPIGEPAFIQHLGYGRTTGPARGCEIPVRPAR